MEDFIALVAFLLLLDDEDHAIPPPFFCPQAQAQIKSRPRAEDFNMQHLKKMIPVHLFHTILRFPADKFVDLINVLQVIPLRKTLNKWRYRNKIVFCILSLFMALRCK